MEEWEEPLHPGSLVRTYPTSSHNATLLAHFLPPRLTRPLTALQNAHRRGVAGADDGSRGRARVVQAACRSTQRASAPCSSPLACANAAADTYDLTRSRLASAGRARSDHTPLPSARSSSPPPRAVALTVCAVVVGDRRRDRDRRRLGRRRRSRHRDQRRSGQRRSGLRRRCTSARTSARKAAKQAAALAAGQALTHQADPYTRLLSVLQTPGSPAPDFGRDVEPWLGRAGRDLPELAELLGAGPDADPAGPARSVRRRRGSFPFGSEGAPRARSCSTRRDVGQGALVPASRRGARRRACHQLPRGLLPG